LDNFLGFQYDLDQVLLTEVEKIADQCPINALSLPQIKNEFFGRLNEKLNINKTVLGDFYGTAAASKFTFNYHQKKVIASFINRNNSSGLQSFLKDLDLPDALIENLRQFFNGADEVKTREVLLEESHTPTKLRKKLERKVLNDVAASAAGCLLWSMYDQAALRKHFASLDSYAISDNFLDDLETISPELFSRDRALLISKFNESILKSDDLNEVIRGFIQNEFSLMSNYGYVALIIDVVEGNESIAWNLASFAQFFGERFLLTDTNKVFFRKDEIKRVTTKQIAKLNLDKAKFNLMTEGFTYRDLFVLHSNNGNIQKLVLIMQKNARDETVIPCPTCRSSNVRGNSYSSLGVKSWECQNNLCSDRSIYNRGKRYSFKSLLMQEAIEQEDNSIPQSLIKEWRRDVGLIKSDSEILNMLIRFFSMSGDTVVIQEMTSIEIDLPAGRKFKFEKRSIPKYQDNGCEDAFFSRFLPDTNLTSKSKYPNTPVTNTVIHGDSAIVLSKIQNNVFDVSLTSPPYYNAREYSQWENIYLYLHEMFNINSEVFRTLKPGGYYFFNIFDYFDNENTITFSEMGKKRLTLAAVFVEMFKRIGFEFVGASVWDKGDIEGKRSFNAGNSSPFYQAPLNCWEHVLIFKKKGKSKRIQSFNKVLKISPVIKMIRGVNTLGHTAPFPIELPKVFLKELGSNILVLDPFGGSGTTANAAIDLDQEFILIEKDKKYAKLSSGLIGKHLQKKH
jgi:DNA modification methylase